MYDPTDVEGLHENVMHRAVLTKTDDSGTQQKVNYEGLEGEEHTEVVRLLPHGVISVPPNGAEGVVIALGTRDMPMFLGGEHPDQRPKGLPAGAGGFYDSAGCLVYSDGKGNVIVKGAKTLKAEVEGDCQIKAAKIILEGAIELKGDITHTGNMTTSGTHTDVNGPHTA